MALINDVLELSQLEAGNFELKLEPLGLSGLVKENIALCEDNLKSKGQDSLVDIPDDLPLLWLDKRSIMQVLKHLLDNAIDLADQGSVKVVVRFSQTSELIGRLSIVIIDTGANLTSAALSTIFDPYSLEEASRRRHSVNGGTSLGLPITKGLVEQMGGKLLVESSIDKGSCFTVLLPQVKYARGNK